jgi:hypothetical protein
MRKRYALEHCRAGGGRAGEESERFIVWSKMSSCVEKKSLETERSWKSGNVYLRAYFASNVGRETNYSPFLLISFELDIWPDFDNYVLRAPHLVLFLFPTPF